MERSESSARRSLAGVCRKSGVCRETLQKAARFFISQHIPDEMESGVAERRDGRRTRSSELESGEK